MKYVALILLNVLIAAATASGQVQKIVHQEFEISDSITEVQLEVYGEYEVEAWPGNNILLETQIRLYNATDGILKHFLETGRYKLEASQEGRRVHLISMDQERRPIKTTKGECFEDIEQKLFVPEEFTETAEGLWQRPPKEESDPAVNTFDRQAKGVEPEQIKPAKKEEEGGNG